jgi:hypothetical protein
MLNIKMLCCNLFLSPLHSGDVTNNIIAFSCFSGHCKNSSSRVYMKCYCIISECILWVMCMGGCVHVFLTLCWYSVYVFHHDLSYSMGHE